MNMFAKSPAIRKRGDGAGDDAVVVAIHIPIGYGSRAIISEVEGWWCVRVTWQATNTYEREGDEYICKGKITHRMITNERVSKFS